MWNEAFIIPLKKVVILNFCFIKSEAGNYSYDILFKNFSRKMFFVKKYFVYFFR